MPLSVSRAGAGSSGGGEVTLYECDFTAQSAQAFSGDGVKTLSSGKKIAAYGTASCSSSGLVAGIGLRSTINVATVGLQVGFSLGVASVPELATLPAGEEWIYTAAFSVSAQSSNLERAMLYVGESGVSDRSVVGFRYNGGQKIFHEYADPLAAATVSNDAATNLTDNVFQVRIKSGAYLEAWSGPFTGGASGAWKDTLRLRGSRLHTVQTAQWIAGVQSVGVGLNGAGGVAMNGRTITLAYMSIKRRGR